MRTVPWLAALTLTAVFTACGGDGDGPAASPSSTETATAASPETATPGAATPATATPTEAPPTATPTPTDAPPAPTPTEAGPAVEPAGFPIDPGQRLGVVVGESPDRSIDWDAGPSALQYSRDDQPSNDPAWSNRAGWNCRVHVEYEGIAASDWYIPTGTPLIATMDGTATLYITTMSNAFDVYGVSREPYIGDPDRARAPISAFPGPGGGKGAYIELTNATFALEYAHLTVTRSLEVIPEGAFVEGYSAGTDYASLFGEMRDFRQSTRIASWEVKRGDVLGYSGDSGYSEAPHLHYTIRRHGGPLLCPASEPGFSDSGWLFR